MMNPKATILFAAVFLSLLRLESTNAAESIQDVKIDIPFKKYVLTNGLTLIVHEDHKAPIVAVNLWYHVGSKNEKLGKTGFAHLFEHLMFTGSEHFKGGADQRAFFEAMERIGATDLNGTTSEDRTDFFENVPTNALDVALWIESDRMGHFQGAIDQARLDVQRGVVQNEKRQGENQPYGETEELIVNGTAPVGHPYLIDRPDSLQSDILAGHVAPPKSNPDEIAIETMNTILGGTFTSRVNMNLREGKHWSYGAFTFMWPAQGQRPFIVYAPVQTDKTKESLVELNKELRAILDTHPISEKELNTAQKNQTLQLPGRWETDESVAGSIQDIVTFGLPDDYFTTYSAKVRSLSVSEVEKAAKEVVHPDQLVWVVVGDRSKVESAIRDLGWGEVRLLDADGNPAK